MGGRQSEARRHFGAELGVEDLQLQATVFFIVTSKTGYEKRVGIF